MDIVKAGIGIGKTIKNIQRLKEIISVLWRNGFDEIFIQTGLHQKVPGFAIPQKRIQSSLNELDREDLAQAIGFRLRRSFEELGPSFIKIGQLIASREDLFPKNFTDQLKLLQNKAGKVSFDQIKSIIEGNIGKKIDEVFSEFDTTPIGVASIGIVYKAKLKNETENVVVKVRRPQIKEIVHHDFEIIKFLIQNLERASNEIKFLGLSRAIDDFFKSIQFELNFLIEAQNAKKLKANLSQLKKLDDLKIPKIYDDLTFNNMITMEYLPGIPFNEIKDINQIPGLEKKLMDNVSAFLHTMLSQGFFHADLHGGNFFLLPDNSIGLIDFGLMGQLSRQKRTNLVAIFYALSSQNYENLVYEFLDIADYENIPDHEELQRDIKDALIPFLGLSAQNLDVTELVHAIVSNLSKHEIFLPREWFIIFRSLMTLDGVGKSLGLDLNIFEIIEENIGTIMQDLISKEQVTEDALWLARDTLHSLKVLPRHTRWLFRELAKKNYVIDVSIQGLEKEIRRTSKNVLMFSYTFISATLLVCSFITLDLNKYHQSGSFDHLQYVLWTLSILSFAKGYFESFKK